MTEASLQQTAEMRKAREGTYYPKKTQRVQITNSSRQHQQKEGVGFLLGGLVNGG